MSGSSGRPAASAIDAEISHGRTLLRAHAAALFAIASLLLDDGDVAAQVVVDVIADASSDTAIPAGAADTLALLAGTVYQRCLDLVSAHSPVRSSSSTVRADGAAAVLARLSFRHRAIVGLVLIGGQDVALAARTLGTPQQTVVTDLFGAIESIRATVTSPTLQRPLNPHDGSG
jgi:DNA-directed RNA polymerase specialized sigma24 family protein